MRVTGTSIGLCLLLSLGACTADEPRGPDGVVVPGGKEDDFFSDSAREYILEGRTSVTLEPELQDADEETRLARVRELIGYKQIAIAWFVTQYLVAKESEQENSDFGGFGGLAKDGEFKDLDVEPTGDLTYAFTFRQLVAGGNGLMDQLPLTVGEDGKPTFDLAIGKPTNEEMSQLETNHEWYRKAPWGSWNPDEVPDDQKEVVTFSIEPERASTDAWFDFNSLFEDGVLDIDIYFGWDYHDDFHVKHPRSLFSWLVDRGFEPPVDTFEELDRESGPFTKTLAAHGRQVEVQVRVYYPHAGGATDPDTDAGGIVLENDMRDSLRTRDVIAYSGHSGPFYGFALANWRKTEEGDLDDSEMSQVEMPAERYQVVLAEGCDTYQIGEAFRNNPAKPDGRFVDVITTTSFSNAATPATVEDFITRLTDEDAQGRHEPRTILSLLTDLDSNSFWFNTMYGVHGIDDDPAIHPYAEVENLCAPCSSADDCGGPGNLCIGLGQGDGSVCAAACTDDRGCPDGYSCRPIADPAASVIFSNACVPTDLRCD